MNSTMTVAELIEALEGMDPEAPVYLAMQPEYPLAFAIANVTDVTPEDDYDEDEDDQDVEDQPRTVWIAATGSHPRELPSPYAPRDAWA